MSNRIAKVNALVGTTVSAALVHYWNNPDVMATVGEVATSPDLRSATVWVSVAPDTEANWQLVEELTPSLQAYLGQHITLKHTPRLALRRDQGPAYAQRINQLLGRGKS